MQAEMKGGNYRVVVDESEVAEFMKSWPASGLDRETEYTFEFSAMNGDLVDIEARSENELRSLHEDEGGEALRVLSEDAGKFGALELGLDDVIAIRNYASPQP